VSSLNRRIAGEVLVHHLTEGEQLIDQELLARHGRSSRTLVKEGPMRLAIVALAAGGELAAHRAPGPVTVQLLDGEATFIAGGRDYPMKPRDILVLAAGVEHSARSEKGGVFLLTVVDAGTAPGVSS
jgi:quercetin dioxygenase-like cupin family protein